MPPVLSKRQRIAAFLLFSSGSVPKRRVWCRDHFRRRNAVWEYRSLVEELMLENEDFLKLIISAEFSN
jgi:hypothetical protein